MNGNKQFVSKEEYEAEITRLRSEIEELRQFNDIFRTFFPFVLREIEKSGHLKTRKLLEFTFESHLHTHGGLTAVGLRTFSDFIMHSSKDRQSYLDGDFSMSGKASKKIAEFQRQTQEALSRYDQGKKSDPA